MFTKNTTGYGLGEALEKDTFKNISQGNLAGRGIAHFYDKKEITELLHSIGFKNVVSDSLNYTDRGSIIEQFLVQAEKRGKTNEII